MAINIPFHFAPRPYQHDAFHCLKKHKRAVMVWHRRAGKDKVCLNILACEALKRKGLYLYVFPYYKQGRMAIWEGMDGSGFKYLDHFPKELVARKNSQEMTLELKNGSVVRFAGSDNIDSIVGSNPVGIIMSEFSLHKPEAWHYLRPILAENGGWCIFNGTPRGLNHFYQMVEMAKKSSEFFVDIKTITDTGAISLEDIKKERDAGMPESLLQQEFYCLFTASGEESLIPLDIIHPAIERFIESGKANIAPRIMGVDVAFAAKGDKAVIAQRHGRRLYPLMDFQGIDNMLFASRIAHQIQKWRPDVVFIDAGRGEGVISRLYQLGHQDVIIPIDFGGAAINPRLYANRKSEMWGRCKDWFQKENPSIPSSEVLIKELSEPTFSLDDKNRIKVESKAALRVRGVSSTDLADALILTFAEEFTPDPIEMLRDGRLDSSQISNDEFLEIYSERNKKFDEYDILNHMGQYYENYMDKQETNQQGSHDPWCY